MKTSLSLEYRLTTGYVSGWKHLDSHVHVCNAQHTKMKRVSGDRDGDSDTMKAVVILLPGDLEAAKASYRRVMRDLKKQRGSLTFSRFMTYAIGDAFTSGCRCEFDCCGCWQYSASAERTKNREFVATIRCYRNV